MSELLKWWPIIVFLASMLVMAVSGFFSLRTEVVRGREERIGQIRELRQEFIGQIKESRQEFIDHEKSQVAVQVEIQTALSTYQTEQGRRLSVIEADIKEVLRRGRATPPAKAKRKRS
jgi:hypothetical protein